MTKSKPPIKIKHVSWRDGKPRFNPGPVLRDYGFKGENIKRHDGSWCNAQETLTWVEEKIRNYPRIITR